MSHHGNACFVGYYLQPLSVGPVGVLIPRPPAWQWPDAQPTEPTVSLCEVSVYSLMQLCVWCPESSTHLRQKVTQEMLHGVKRKEEPRGVLVDGKSFL